MMNLKNKNTVDAVYRLVQSEAQELAKAGTSTNAMLAAFREMLSLDNRVVFDAVMAKAQTDVRARAKVGA